MRYRVFRLEISREQEKTILLRYPRIKFFLEKMISNTAEKIIIEEGQFNTGKELKEYHDRRVLNNYDIHKRKMTQATKDKISKAQKGKHTGWHQFPETIEKIRLANLGKNTGPNLKARGQKRTEKQRRNIGLGHKGLKYKKHAKVGLN